jgi:DNA-binding response OmpR family regulator
MPYNLCMSENDNLKTNPSKRILVIDDDPDIGLMIKMMLEFRGYWVMVMDRAEKTKEIVTDNKIELIIMDMLLSGVNGVDICRVIKQDVNIRHTPVIMISAHPNAKETCLEAGADDFISKPFDMEDMLGKIKRLVNPENWATG